LLFAVARSQFWKKDFWHGYGPAIWYPIFAVAGLATVIGQEQMISLSVRGALKPGKDCPSVLVKHNPPSHCAYAPVEVPAGQV